MNIQYVEFYKYNKFNYAECSMSATYPEIYRQIRSWGTGSYRKLNLLAIF